jgi:hypothetical protein
MAQLGHDQSPFTIKNKNSYWFKLTGGTYLMLHHQTTVYLLFVLLTIFGSTCAKSQDKNKLWQPLRIHFDVTELANRPLPEDKKRWLIDVLFPTLTEYLSRSISVERVQIQPIVRTNCSDLRIDPK